MAIQKKTLRVLPNPWQYIDHLGRAAGACPCDPNEHTPDRRWVGATIDRAVVVRPARTVQIAGRNFVQKQASHDITWKHTDEEVELPNTAYYRQRIAGGELIAADEATALACGIDKFEKPSDLLAKLKEAAIKQFDAENGAGAYEQLGKELAEREAAAKTATPTPKTTSQPDEAPKGDA